MNLRIHPLPRAWEMFYRQFSALRDRSVLVALRLYFDASFTEKAICAVWRGRILDNALNSLLAFVNDLLTRVLWARWIVSTVVLMAG